MNTKKQETDEDEPYWTPTVILAAINIGVYVIMSIISGNLFFMSPQAIVIFAVGKHSFYPLLWFQFITAMFAHASIAHILGNELFLLIFGLRIEELLEEQEHWVYWIYLITGLTANIVSALLLGPDIVSLGASAAVFGLLGYLMNLQKQKNILSLKQSIGFLLIYIVFTMAGPGSATVNFLAHFVGLITGWLLASYYFSNQKLEELKAQSSLVQGQAKHVIKNER